MSPNRHELALINATKFGNVKTYQLDKKGKPTSKIRAEALRRLIVGLALRKGGKPDCVTQKGISIENAIITGKLDLDSWAGRLPDVPLVLPHLSFKNCEFEDVITCKGAFFQSFRFIDCTLKAIFGSHAQFSGIVDLRGSKISGGNLTTGADKNYSILFQNVKINGSLVLSSSEEKRFEAKGIVNLDDANIGGGFYARGAFFSNDTVTDKAAECILSFNGARIRGCVFFNTTNSDDRFEAKGSIHFNGARISGTFEAKGAFLNGGKEKLALCFDHATIEDGVFLGIEELENNAGQKNKPTRFESIGEIRCIGARIGGEFHANGALLCNEGGDCLNFESAKIAGSVQMNAIDYGDTDSNSYRFKAKGRIYFPYAEIGGALSFNGAALCNHKGYTLYFDTTEIKGNVFLRPTKHWVFESIGSIRGRGAHIGGWVIPPYFKGAHK